MLSVCCARALSRCESFLKADRFTGRFAEQLGNTELAIFSYKRALNFNNFSMEALHSIASVLRSEDKYGEAVEYIKTILQMDPHNGESWSSLGPSRPLLLVPRAQADMTQDIAIS